MKLKDYKRCPKCNRINRTGEMCEECIERTKREETYKKRDRDILENFKYKAPNYKEDWGIYD